MLQGKGVTYYTIYKITNLTNGRYYVGKHLTRNLNDGYFGSGKALLEAVRKYGEERFRKEYLFFAFDKESMDWAERQLVVPKKDDPLSYNLKAGGEGGAAFGQSNSFYGKSHTEATKEKIRSKNRGIRRSIATEFKKGQVGLRSGVPHTDETKQRLREAAVHQWKEGRVSKRPKGEYIWVTDGKICRMVCPTSELPTGFVRGRIYRGRVVLK